MIPNIPIPKQLAGRYDASVLCSTTRFTCIKLGLSERYASKVPSCFRCPSSFPCCCKSKIKSKTLDSFGKLFLDVGHLLKLVICQISQRVRGPSSFDPTGITRHCNITSRRGQSYTVPTHRKFPLPSFILYLFSPLPSAHTQVMGVFHWLK